MHEVDGTRDSNGTISRRDVLQATGGALAFTMLGATPALGEDHTCEDAELEQAASDLPEIDLQPESPTTTNLPDSPDEVVIYAYGYNTPYEIGRRQGTTVRSAMQANGYENPVVLAQWESEPEEKPTEDDGDFARAQKFQEAEQNADRDGSTFATWLNNNYSDTTIRLVGYSTGARVCLRALTEVDSSVTINSVSLVGPAVASASICSDSDVFDISQAGVVHAYYSGNDNTTCGSVTDYLQLFASDRDPPALGCKGSDCGGSPPDNFENHDVSSSIDTHCSYIYPDFGVMDQVVTGIENAPAVDDGDGTDGEDGEDGTDGITADVTVTMSNVGTSAWEITDLTGVDGDTPTGVENPSLPLQPGMRYKFVNNGYPTHPLAFRDADDNALLSQSSDGSMEGDSAINWVDNGGELAFTLTESLSAELDDYVCTVHASMNGQIIGSGLDLNASVTFENQTIAGDSVTVASASLEEGGFIVIHTSALLDGNPIESVIGVSSYLDAGDHENIEVTLDEPIEEDQTLIAMAHRDTNENQAYDFSDTGGAEDGPYLAAEGEAVVQPADITLESDDTDGEDGTDGDDGTDGEDGMDGEDGQDGTDGEDGEDGTDGEDGEDGTDGEDGGDGEDGDGSGPGLGVISAISGLGGLGYMLSRRLSDDDSADE
jgi:plastocyanin